MKNIYINGVVYTVTNGVVEAFVEENGVFIYVGDNAGALALQDENSAIKDLDGQFVTAGFNDSHMHTLYTGRALNILNLADAKSIEEFIALGKEYIQKHNPAPGEWVIGFNWNQELFSKKVFPTKEDLDKISTEHPIHLMRTCYHIAVINSKAIEVLGLTPETPVDGGEFDINEKGELSGILKEKALNVAREYATPMNNLKKYIEDCIAFCHSYGITSLQTDDFCTSTSIDYKDVIKAYTELENENKLTMRIYQQSQFATIDVYQQFLADGYRTGHGSPFYKIGPLKMLLDGSLGGRTALMNEPYSDDPTNTGIGLYTGEELDQWFALASQHDMQIACHAIGDKAAYILLDSYEKALKQYPKKDHRHGTIHVQITDLPIIDKIAELNVIAYIQSIFLDYESTIVYDRVGSRADNCYPFKSLIKKGVNVSNGSDSPIELPDVFTCMQIAVTRTSVTIAGAKPYLKEKEGCTIEEAIQTYTINGAFASFEEDKKGSIEVGKYADFVVLSQNLLEIDSYDIHKTSALETYVDGKLVYQH